MSLILTLLILSVHPNTDIVTDSVDIIEFNHVPSRQLNQWIFWDFDPKTGDLVCVDYMIMRTDVVWRLSGNNLYIINGDRNIKVRAFQVRYTVTRTDPEMYHRSILPIEYRRGLARKFRRIKRE